MKVSVAIATYNGEAFVEEQLDSIRNQTRPVDEVVICDDQSKDQTASVVSKYIEKNGLSETWKLVVNEKNKGYASNFIGAADLTSGDIILFCDQDDIWYEDRVEKMVSLMEKNEKILLLGSEFKPFTVDDDAPSVPGWEMKMMKYDGSLEHMDFTSKHVPIGCQGCTMAIRKSFYEKIRPYWYEGWAHDEFVWKLALCEQGLFMYHEATLKRRLHSNNVTMHKMRDLKKRIRFVEELITCHEATLEYIKKETNEKKQQKLIEKNLIGCRYRLKVLKEKKVFYTIPLVFCYSVCYHKKRAILVELMMSIKG